MQELGTATSELEKSWWNDIGGFHEVGKVNEAGKSLLKFLGIKWTGHNDSYMV